MASRRARTRAKLALVGSLSATCPVCKWPMTRSPTRTGTAESESPAKHDVVTGCSDALLDNSCCTCRQAAQLRLWAAISAQNGFWWRLSFWATCHASGVRSVNGRPVASPNARS